MLVVYTTRQRDSRACNFTRWFIDFAIIADGEVKEHHCIRTEYSSHMRNIQEWIEQNISSAKYPNESWHNFVELSPYASNVD